MMCGVALCGALAWAANAQAARVLYQNDFSQAQAGPLPDEFLVYEGAFEVKPDGSGKLVELPGAPLDTFGFYFGPAEKENIAVSARFNSTSKGRLRPTFAVSLGPSGQFKLQMSPAKKALELFKGDAVVQSAPFDWQSGKWSTLLLQVRKAGAVWRIEGKAWQDGQPEPKEWTVAFEDKEEPIAGRPAVWGSPFSGQPIQFDDLKLVSLGQ